MCISNDELVRFNRKPLNNEHDYSVWNIPQDDYGELDDFSEYLSGTKEESMQLIDSDIQQTPSIDETQNFDAPSPNKKRRSYTCPVCSKLWVTPSKLSRHMVVHKSDKKEKPKVKDVQPSFSSPVVYDILKREAAQCPICFQIIESSEKLQQHMLIHKTENQKKETLKKVEEASSLPETVPVAQKVGPSCYICTVCNSVLPSAAKLTNHMRNQHMRKVSIINKNGNPKVPEKMTIHATVNKNVCSICSKVFPTCFKLNRHMSVHKNPKKPPRRPPRPRKYQCQHCDKKFETPSKLQRHQNVHRDIVQVKSESQTVLEISAVTSIMGD